VELRPTTVTEAALSTRYAATSIPIKEVPTITTEICLCNQLIHMLQLIIICSNSKYPLDKIEQFTSRVPLYCWQLHVYGLHRWAFEVEIHSLDGFLDKVQVLACNKIYKLKIKTKR